MRTLFLMAIILFSALPLVSAEPLVQLRPYQRELSLTGFTRPRQSITVTSEVSARCARVEVDVGDMVGVAGIVAELDATFVTLDIQENAIAQEKAVRQLALEKKTVARYSNLINKQSAAQSTYDEALLRADILDLTVKGLKVEELRLQELLKRHTLYGPPGWEVMVRYVEPGEFVQQGAPVVRLGDFRRLVVPFMLTHEELEMLRRTVSIQLHGEELDGVVNGKVSRVGPDFDEKSRKVPVELLIDGISSTGKTLRGGMRMTLQLTGKEEEDVFVVPQSALISRYEANWLVTDGGERKRVIVLGRNSDDGLAVITGDGLSAGDSFAAAPDSAWPDTPGSSER